MAAPHDEALVSTPLTAPDHYPMPALLERWRQQDGPRRVMILGASDPLAACALAAHWDPALLMIPAALSASCAFMLPVATPPNAIVFASGRITVAQMAGHGLMLNLFGAAVITAVCLLIFA